MNKKLIICQGLPASGKSTWTKEFVKGKKDWVIVNRDSLRNMRGDYWIPSQENLITTWEVFCIESAIKAGYNIIIDATNFNPIVLHKWLEMADMYNLEVEIKTFDTSVEECISRDLLRENPVGAMVIRGMYNKYLK